MRNEGGEVHSETDEARGGSTPNIVRWILVISTLAAIILLSAVWIFGAASSSDSTHEPTASDAIRASEASGPTSDTDSIVGEQEADQFAPDTPADAVEDSEAQPVQPTEN